MLFENVIPQSATVLFTWYRNWEFYPLNFQHPIPFRFPKKITKREMTGRETWIKAAQDKAQSSLAAITPNRAWPRVHTCHLSLLVRKIIANNYQVSVCTLSCCYFPWLPNKFQIPKQNTKESRPKIAKTIFTPMYITMAKLMS